MWLAWGTDFRELSSDAVGQEPVAIIQLADGTVESHPIHDGFKFNPPLLPENES